MAALLERGSLLRKTGSTNMNAQSSRSHAIFSITVEQRRTLPPEPGVCPPSSLAALPGTSKHTLPSRSHHLQHFSGAAEGPRLLSQVSHLPALKLRVQGPVISLLLHPKLQMSWLVPAALHVLQLVAALNR